MNQRNLNFTFAFKCEDDFEHFKKLPIQDQHSIEIDIVDVIYQSFVTPGDEDYITARFLAQNGLHRAFFWSASQALEKYLKAFLLMRGVSVKNFGRHSVIKLFKRAVLEDHRLEEISTKFHPEIKLHPNVANCIPERSLSEFLIEIETNGDPNNRYNSFGVNFDSGHLFALDSFVFGLRQYIGVPSIGEAFQKMDKHLIYTFHNHNPCFSPNHTKLKIIPNSEFKLRLSNATTVLDRLLQGKHPERNLALAWLDKKMKIPSKPKVIKGE